MFTKTLFATSALVVASSFAFAGEHHGTLPKGETWQTLREHHDAALRKQMPGVILSREGVPFAVRAVANRLNRNAPAHEAKDFPGGGKFNTFSKDKNALFLSFFGWLAGTQDTSTAYSGSYCISYSANGACINTEMYKDTSKDDIARSAAQPFTGVSSAKEISIGAEQYGGTGGVKLAIYSNQVGSCGGAGNGYSTTTAASCPGTAVHGATGTVSSLASYNGQCCDVVNVKFKNATLSSGSQYWVVATSNGTSGTIVWNAQNINFTSIPSSIEDYKFSLTSSYKDSYRTTKSGHTQTYHGSYHTSSDGWVSAISFSYEDQPAAMSIK